jgi:hypothetical protein
MGLLIEAWFRAKVIVPACSTPELLRLCHFAADDQIIFAALFYYTYSQMQNDRPVLKKVQVSGPWTDFESDQSTMLRIPQTLIHVTLEEEEEDRWIK